jgi:hypothetical protein
LKVRPIFHGRDDRIRGPIFLGMLADDVEWHMRAKLAPLLVDDHQRAAAESKRTSIGEPAPGSEAAQAQDASKRTGAGLPVHRFGTLRDDRATLAKNRVRVGEGNGSEFDELTQASAVQQRALDRLGVAT